MRALRIRLVVAADGERLPILVDADGMPAFRPTVYAISALWPTSGSFATMQQALYGVAALEEFAAVRSISLEDRVASGRFLELREIDGLIQRLGAPRPKRGKHARPRIGAVPPQDTRSPAIQTIQIRIGAIVEYIEWLTDVHARPSWTSLAARADGQRLLERFIERLKAMRPRAGSSKERFGLTPGQQEILTSALAPAGIASMWPDRFVAERNRFWFDFVLETGLRMGEILSLRLSDIDLEASTYRVVRRPVALDEPRRRPALVKGLGRMLDMTAFLTGRTRTFIEEWRARWPGAKEHPFLFVARGGAPLSQSAVVRFHIQLRERYPALGAAFSSHIGRHTWAEAWDAVVGDLGIPEGDAARAKALALGWANPSSDRHYSARRIRGALSQVALGMQERCMEGCGDDE